MRLISSLVLGLVAVHSATAAECYGSARHPEVDFHALAYSVCKQGPDAEQYFGNKFAEAHFEGDLKLDCEKAFENIFYQCIHNEGRNGGEWTYEYNGVKQKYWMQSNENFGS